MIKCSNCETEAVYRYRVTGDYSILFCFTCLPSFLKSPSYKGRVVKVASEVIEPEVAPKKRSTKKVVEEPVVEEAAPEESVAEDVAVEPSTEETVVESDGTD
jgi:hypothetical protein